MTWALIKALVKVGLKGRGEEEEEELTLGRTTLGCFGQGRKIVITDQRKRPTYVGGQDEERVARGQESHESKHYY